MARGVVLALALTSAVAHSTTLLTVDLSTNVRPVSHVASGSLYGVLETQPADVNGLIAPLHPNVFNNPAADVQQPIGDAIVVAGRVARSARGSAFAWPTGSRAGRTPSPA